jgi:hypothetical protein
LTPNIPIWAIRENRGVLQWNLDLIVEAIGDPALDGFSIEASLVHREMEGMVDMVVRFHIAKSRFEVFPALAFVVRLHPSTISIPS